MANSNSTLLLQIEMRVHFVVQRFTTRVTRTIMAVFPKLFESRTISDKKLFMQLFGGSVWVKIFCLTEKLILIATVILTTTTTTTSTNGKEGSNLVIFSPFRDQMHDLTVISFTPLTKVS